jgi:hypothetical protein
MARPTMYRQEIATKAWYYLDNFEEYSDIFPSIVGLVKLFRTGNPIVA